MILNVEAEVASLKKAITAGEDMALAMEVVKILDRGMSMERACCIKISQAKAIRPMEIVRQIRKPIR